MEPGHWDKDLSPEDEKENAQENKTTIYKLQLAEDEDFGFYLKKPAEMICSEIMAEEEAVETDWGDIINSINKEYKTF